MADPDVVGVLVGKLVCVTFVTIGELRLWSEIRSWGEVRRQRMDALLSRMTVLPYQVDVSNYWGQLSAAARQRGRPRPVNDTWIAACCLAARLPLVTYNRRDFEDFRQHHGLQLLP